MESYTSNFCPVSFTCTMCQESTSKYLPPGTKMTSCGKCGNLITLSQLPRSNFRQQLQREPNQRQPLHRGGFQLPEMTPYPIPDYDSDDNEAYLNHEEEFNQFLNAPISRRNNSRSQSTSSNGMFSIHVPNDRFNQRRAYRIPHNAIDEEDDFDRMFEQELNDYLHNENSLFSRIVLPEMPKIALSLVKPKPKLKKISMTRKLYTKNAKGKLEAPVCCICLSNMKLNDNVAQLKCKHLFHYTCLDKWIQTKEECPFCRGKISQ